MSSERVEVSWVVGKVLYRDIVPYEAPSSMDALLLRVWPELMLPERCRVLWETRFPELTAP